MSPNFQLTIVTPESVVLNETVDFLSLEAETGSLGILANHTPLIANLKIAPLHYTKEGKTSYAAVMGGFLKVRENQVVILTPAGETEKDIDALRAEEARKRAEARLTLREEQTNWVQVESALRRALTRLKVVQNAKQHSR